MIRIDANINNTGETQTSQHPGTSTSLSFSSYLGVLIMESVHEALQKLVGVVDTLRVLSCNYNNSFGKNCPQPLPNLGTTDYQTSLKLETNRPKNKGKIKNHTNDPDHGCSCLRLIKSVQILTESRDD